MNAYESFVVAAQILSDVRSKCAEVQLEDVTHVIVMLQSTQIKLEKMVEESQQKREVYLSTQVKIGTLPERLKYKETT